MTKTEEKTFINKNNLSISSKGSKKVKSPIEDRIYYTVIYTLLIFILLIVLYPLVYIVSASFSSPEAVTSGKVVLFPVSPSLAGYKAVFKYKDVFIGYRNTFFYTIVGTAVNVAMTLMTAYPLSRKTLPGKGFFTFLFTFTMLFSGGMIPNYMLMKQLHLLNTPWVMIIPGAIGVTNLIITRTFMQSNIPQDLLEAAQIDGCSDFKYFFSVVLPLSQANIAVITLYYAVGHWNSYFNAFLFLSNKRLFPLQLFLRDILLLSQIDSNSVANQDTLVAVHGLADLLKYSLIVVATVPILCLYPFVQRYFVKGVMIGSLKG
ncbi:MAG: carbohydrate ABC transporter permease [Bacillota bacterium]|nr:carbohydrate ABC transporter permease [Bacillota bacterium]